MPYESTCMYCNRPITLRPQGQHHKWMVTTKAPRGGKRHEWNCGGDPAKPLRAHQPDYTLGTPWLEEA